MVPFYTPERESDWCHERSGHRQWTWELWHSIHACFKSFPRDFPGGPVVKTLPSNAGDIVLLVWELRCRMPHDQKVKT